MSQRSPLNFRILVSATASLLQLRQQSSHNHVSRHIEFIATSHPSDPVLTPAPLFYDEHVYDTPSECLIDFSLATAIDQEL